AEEFPWSVAAPTLYPRQTTQALGPPYLADPGDTYAPMFLEAPLGMTRGQGYELLIGLSGALQWGGCRVHRSIDDVTYSEIGLQQGPSTMGFLTAGLPYA